MQISSIPQYNNYPKYNSTNFRALTIDKKALKNLNCVNKKQLLKKTPTLSKLAEKAEVVIQKGRRNGIGEYEQSIFKILMPSLLGGGVCAGVIAALGLTPISVLSASLALVFGIGISSLISLNTHDTFNTNIDISEKDRSTNIIAKDFEDMEHKLQDYITMQTKTVEKIEPTPNEIVDKASDIKEGKLMLIKAELNKKEFLENMKIFCSEKDPAVVIDFLKRKNAYGNTPLNIASDVDIIKVVCKKLKEAPEDLREILETPNAIYKLSIIDQFINCPEVNDYIKALYSPKEYANLTERAQNNVIKSIAAFEAFDVEPHIAEEVSINMRVVGYADPKKLVRFMNTIPENDYKKQVRSYSLAIEANVSTFPYKTINDVLKNNPKELSEIYLFKPKNNAPSYLQTLLNQTHRMPFYKDLIFDYIEIIKKDEVENRNTKKQINEWLDSLKTSSRRFPDDVVEKLTDYLKEADVHTEAVLMPSEHIDFSDIKQISLDNVKQINRYVQENRHFINYEQTSSGENIICAIADIRKTKENSQDYDEMINTLSKISGIDYQKKDLVGIPFVEKVIHTENRQLLELIKNEKFEYYPLLDKAFERITDADFKKDVQKLKIDYPDLKQAVRLASYDALKLLEGQINSPFFKEENSIELLQEIPENKSGFKVYLGKILSDKLTDEKAYYRNIDRTFG